MDDSKGKTVVHVITKATWGGAQVYVYDLLEEARKRGFATKLIYGVEGELVEKLRETSTQCIRIPSLSRNASLLRDLRSLMSLYTLFRKERGSYIHLHSSKAGFIGSLAGVLARAPYVFFTAHGWPHNESRPEWQKLACKILEWCTILFSHKTIAVSDTVHAQAPDFLLHHKVVTIKNGVAPFSLFGKDNARIVLGMSRAPQSFIFGTIAELHQNKGLDILIKSFADVHKLFPDTKLCIIGGGEEERALKDLIAKEKLGEHVHFLGHVSNAKEYLKAFTVFVLPSRTEALGYVLLEAGVARVPCISTRVGGIPEIIEHQKTGLLVSKEDIRELSLAMQFALTHKEELLAYSGNLYEKVVHEYSREMMLEKIFHLYSTPKNS